VGSDVFEEEDPPSATGFTESFRLKKTIPPGDSDSSGKLAAKPSDLKTIEK